MIVVNTTDIGKPYTAISLVSSGTVKGSEQEAVQEMIKQAIALSADAIVNVRISHSIRQHLVMSVSYHAHGTAVKFA